MKGLRETVIHMDSASNADKSSRSKPKVFHPSPISGRIGEVKEEEEEEKISSLAPVKNNT
uniref:Uncharacterized protein n=1 Tax=Pristionchus pacificus TaxID=54126 RepID=A0A2A6C720_PRIPA|eukprot:PDM73853.1 hypothetical protein PRIPAC_41209 [Pristionchus pacificus]